MGAILCFHSITTPALPAAGDAHVPLDAFESAIRVARRVGELVPLSELVRLHADGRSTSGLIAVTLDDAYAALSAGFRDFVSREAVPITIFVVTGAAANGATYWWDRIDDLFPHIPPDRWLAFEKACGLPDDYRQGQPREYGPLRPLRQWLLAMYAGRWPDHLEPALVALEEDGGCRTRQRSMTFTKLAELQAMPWVEVGVHTASHPVLPLLSDRELEREVTASYDVLRERCAAVVPVLAVPFGLYDERTLRAARAAGMTASLTLAGGTVNGRTRSDALPRICLTRSDSPARLGLRLLGLPDVMRRVSRRRVPTYPDLPSATT